MSTGVIRIMAREKGPGPGAYALPRLVGFWEHDFTKNRAPAYSLRMRLKTDDDFSYGPGPTYMIPEGYTRVGPNGEPKYTMRPKTKLGILESCAPSPAAYYPNPYGPTAPKYSFGLKADDHNRNFNPAPNAYGIPTTIGPKVPDKKAMPAYSIRHRTGAGFGPTLGPGPAVYYQEQPNVYKPRAPIYTMRPKLKQLGESTPKPGPADYNTIPVVLPWRFAPKFPFGIKHSEYVTEFLEHECN